MSVGSVTGMDGTTGAGPVSHDVGDIAFLVALLEVETLDIDIGGRLTQMQQLNAVRKAYNERIAELQSALDRCGDDGRVAISLADAQRGDLVWDAAARDGAGGVVSVGDGREPMGTGQYEVYRADGSPALMLDLLDKPRPAPRNDIEARQQELERELWESLAGNPIRTSNADEAQQCAEMVGGTVMVTVTRDELAGELQVLRDKMDGLSSDAEVGMLGLNRLLSRRNQVLQLASNVMSSQHQTAMGLIANLKV